MIRMFLILAAIFVGLDSVSQGSELPTLRVMTLNLYHGGTRLGQPLSQTVKAVNAAKADVVGLQETESGNGDSSIQLAKMLKWHCFSQGGRTSVISKYPIVGNTPAKWGVHIQLPDKTVVHVYNAHFHYVPYQPYQLANIPYGDFPFITTEKEAIHWANEARGGQVTRMLSELTVSLKSGVPCFLTGDFNEPSHQDWTTAVADKGHVPIKVAYPTTSRITKVGMVDGFRAAHHDPLLKTGWTWTPTTKSTDPDDRHDRIDYVLSSLPSNSVKFAGVVGESKENADIVVSPWPTDHRGVVVEYQLNKKP
ncbi:MAG: endonuclease [Planctomycetaceae bacterium]|nr:endonuclease [Planctomycetaceae bacterium]|tara:strand:+ start:2488 stop:3411 length:924 start_codon:yes stop_codon:yes gene_type:complete